MALERSAGPVSKILTGNPSNIWPGFFTSVYEVCKADNIIISAIALTVATRSILGLIGGAYLQPTATRR